MSLVAHRFGRVEFKVSNICFYFFKCTCLKKNTTNILAISMIDRVINVMELHSVPNKNLLAVARKVDSQWLCRCPRSLEIIFDNGNEFLGLEFKELISSHGIYPK